MRVKNLRCLRDPDFKTHPWHAGHISKLATIDPRQEYEDKQRRQRIGRNLMRAIQEWEKHHGPDLTRMERQMLYVFMRTEITTNYNLRYPYP